LKQLRYQGQLQAATMRRTSTMDFGDVSARFNGRIGDFHEDYKHDRLL
jgi:hypothetical protein